MSIFLIFGSEVVKEFIAARGGRGDPPYAPASYSPFHTDNP